MALGEEDEEKEKASMEESKKKNAAARKEDEITGDADDEREEEEEVDQLDGREVLDAALISKGEVFLLTSHALCSSVSMHRLHLHQMAGQPQPAAEAGIRPSLPCVLTWWRWRKKVSSRCASSFS